MDAQITTEEVIRMVDTPTEAPKKEAPKAAPAKEAEVKKDLVTVSMLAEELGTKAHILRRFLRDTYGKQAKPGTRWAWEKNDPRLAEIRKAWAASKAQVKKEKAEKPAEKVPA